METKDKIKQHLSEMEISQSKLAELSGLAFGTINRILNGKQDIKPNTLAKIAEALNLSVADLEDERSWSFNYAVQGYLQFGNDIQHITSFEQLKRWVKKYEPLVNELPQQAKAILSEERRNARKVAQTNTNPIDRDSINFYREEKIDATKVETWSFRKGEDERDGYDINLGNMCIAYPFVVNGHKFTNSEALYICGLFSNDTTKHQEIQTKLLAAKSGYDAKKAVRTKYADSFGREDWETFNVEWMIWCVWQKIQGNEDFKNTLLNIPKHAHIIENSTHQKGLTATFWGMNNTELEDKRDILEQCTEYENPTMKSRDLKAKLMKARNKINHIGTWQGVNCMGKILKYLQLCLIDGVEPTIDYELLRSKNIYLFGELLAFPEKTVPVKHKTIIFDFDGTLLDTEPWQQYEHLFKQPQRGTDEWKEGRREYLRHITDCKQWEGMDEVIAYLREQHIRTVVVTANTKDRVVEAVKAFGWEDVVDEHNIFGCYSLGMRRASKADVFKKALEVLKVRPDECLAFGNELNDKQAAQTVGITAYNCLWGVSEEEKEIMLKDEASTLKKPIEIIRVLESKVGVE